MSWHFLQEQAAESWEGTCLDGAPAALLKLMPTQEESFLRANGTDCYRPFPCGTTCAPSTGAHGRAKLTLFQAGSPAPTSAQPGKAPGSMAKKADSGWKWHGSFAKWDHDLCSWKTRQCSLLGDSEEFSGTWPRWGSMRAGECLELTTPVPRRNGNEYGSWPTPRANDGEKRGNFDTTNPRNGLPAAVKRHMTPTASIGTKCGGRHNGRADTLASQIAELEGLAVSSTGQLNPLWVEWLMGWPAGWTDYAALETDRFREWRQQHGGF